MDRLLAHSPVQNNYCRHIFKRPKWHPFNIDDRVYIDLCKLTRPPSEVEVWNLKECLDKLPKAALLKITSYLTDLELMNMMTSGNATARHMALLEIKSQRKRFSMVISKDTFKRRLHTPNRFPVPILRCFEVNELTVIMEQKRRINTKFVKFMNRLCCFHLQLVTNVFYSTLLDMLPTLKLRKMIIRFTIHVYGGPGPSFDVNTFHLLNAIVEHKVNCKKCIRWLFHIPSLTGKHRYEVWTGLSNM